MKNKALISLSISIILLLTSIGAATADISFLTSDGVWGLGDGSARRWGTGPTDPSPNGTTGLVTSSSSAVQTPPTNDWNQIRYGAPPTWNEQSGLAFRGTNNNGMTYVPNTPFLVGKFCHKNSEINGQALTNVLLSLNLTGLSCGTGAVPPLPPTSLSFTFPVNLDETTNSGLLENCPYPGSTTICDDAVTFSQSDTNYTCNYTGNVSANYTLALVGFMHLNTLADACEAVVYNQAEANGIFISPEGTTNCGCLFAMITSGNVNAISLYSFDASSSASGASLSWETADETNNLGFNIYRADSLIAERVKLNDGLIASNVPPGSPFGALYSFEDLTAENFQSYFYWLEDVDVNGTSTLHGPVKVEK